MKTHRPATASVPHTGNIAQFSLDNGITLLVYENFASPAVIVSGYFTAGMRDESPLGTGLSGFVTDCLTRGTTRRSYAQIYDVTESIGASMGVSAGTHTSSLYAKSLAEDLPLMLDLLSDVVRHPSFPAEELERERAEWVSALRERENSTRAQSGMAFYDLCYPEGHPYHYPGGTLETAKAITREQVLEHHRTFFSPREMTLCIVGAVKAEEALARVVAAFGDWTATRPERAPMIAAPPIVGQPRRHIPLRNKSQTTLQWGFPALPRNDPDWIPAVLMNSILGQFGMYGRLGERVRKEEGLVYYIGTSFSGGIGPGAWQCHAGTQPTTVDRVVEISRNEVRRIQDKRVTTRELDDNKRYFVGSLPLQMETNEGIAGRILDMRRYNLGFDYLLNYAERINSITAAQLQGAAQRWLNADNFVLTSSG
jgi:zinc protease